MKLSVLLHGLVHMAICYASSGEICQSFERRDDAWLNFASLTMGQPGDESDLPIAGRAHLNWGVDLACDFDGQCVNANFSKWVNEAGQSIAKIDWVRVSTGDPVLGPKYDLTYGNGSGHFMFANGAGFIRSSKAVLLSQEVTGMQCYAFYYYANGSEVDYLAVGINPVHSYRAAIVKVIEYDESTKGQWLYEDVTITESMVNSTIAFRIFFMFVIEGPEAVIGLDDIVMTVEKCPICRNLTAPLNGNVYYNSTSIKSVARYTCNQGYQLVGNKTRRCSITRDWDGEEPVCVGICGNLTAPINGEVHYTSITVGSVARYSCNHGYQLVGRTNRTCRQNRAWGGRPPTCVPIGDCGHLTAPFNGHVSYNSTSVGSVATYSCDPGYQLRGTTNRKCRQNGIWGSVAPTCIENCGNLTAPLNGHVSYNSTTVGSVATYSCDSAYQLTGNSTRKCLENFQWEGFPPTCNGMCFENGTFNPFFNGTVVVDNPAPDMFRHALSFDNDGLCVTNFSSDNLLVTIAGCLMRDVIIAFHNDTDGLDVIIGGDVIVMHAYTLCEKMMFGVTDSISNDFRPLHEEFVNEKSVSVYVQTNMRLVSPTGTVIISGLIGQHIYWTVDIPAVYHGKLIRCSAYPGVSPISSGRSKLLIEMGCTRDHDLVASFDSSRHVLVSGHKRYYTSFYPFKFYYSDYITIGCSILICNQVNNTDCDFTCPPRGRRALSEEPITDDQLITTTVTMKVVDPLLGWVSSSDTPTAQVSTLVWMTLAIFVLRL